MLQVKICICTDGECVVIDIHRRLKWEWSWADPAWQCPLPLLSMRKTTFLKSSFSGLRTVSPLATAVGSIWQNLSDVVNAFKSFVIDFKGSLSKFLSLRFPAIWDSRKHRICSHDYPPWQISWRTGCFVGIRIRSFLLFRLFTVISWGKAYIFAPEPDESDVYMLYPETICTSQHVYWKECQGKFTSPRLQLSHLGNRKHGLCNTLALGTDFYEGR